MDKIYVVYWSQTGNTEAMAEAVARGIRSEGKESAVVEVGSISPEELKEEAVFALGCPAMGAEVLEESEMEPFVETLETFVKGKTVGLFGSYGWGDGEWMRSWEERCKNAGIQLACDSVICNEMPDDEGLKQCEKLGEKLTEA